MKCFIVVVWYKGAPYFLDSKNELNHFFMRGVKAYIKQGSAITMAKKLSKRYTNDKVCLYNIPYSCRFNATDFMQGRFDDKCVYTIKNNK